MDSLSVGNTTVYIDSAASSHMVSDESFISKHMVEKADSSVRIKGSCGKSSTTKKGTLKFGIRNTQDQVIPVASEVLLVRDLGASIFSVGALAEKGVKYNLLSTPSAPMKGQAVFCSNMMPELGFGESFDSVPLHIDNTSALHVVGNRTYIPRAKHIALRYYFSCKNWWRAR